MKDIMEDKRDVYMVYREGGGMPAKVHYSRYDAMLEAERLARLPVSIRNHAAFYIMQAVQTVKAVEPEVIEVGDDVCGKKGGAYCKVIWIGYEDVMIQQGDSRPSLHSINSLTLIRKGPEVITFEGATQIDFNCNESQEFRSGPLTITLKKEVS